MEKIIINHRYKIVNKIGAGSYGLIFKGVDITNDKEVAIKIEETNCEIPQVLYEAKVYHTLQGNVGIPKLHWAGVEGDYNVLVMETCGPSLEHLRKFCGGRFSLKTTLMLAIQLVERLKTFHSHWLLHRDMKPDNLLIGSSRDPKTLFIIDYGLAKAYRHKITGKHIPSRKGKGITGTVRYSSIHTHRGIESARRDDMESALYVLIYLFKGSLPWQNSTKNFETRDELADYIYDVKENSPTNEIWAGMPEEFPSLLEYTRELKFQEKPGKLVNCYP